MFAQIVNATTTLLKSGFYGPMVIALKGFHALYFQNSGLYRFVYFAVIFSFKLIFAFPLFQTISIHYHTPKQWKILNQMGKKINFNMYNASEICSKWNR